MRFVLVLGRRSGRRYRRDLFVALVGERFDAHDFLSDAVGRGAAGVVVSRANVGRGLGVPVFEVADTLVALGALGRYRRRAWGKTVVGVVGTNGKTSTKELIRAALGSVYEVHATRGNLNNLIGVPLTLLSIPDGADVAVVEMGTNQPGEVPRLRAIVEPDITVVTSVAEEHLEGLGDLAGVLREEMAAADGVEVAIVPASQPEVVDAARARANRVVTAGLDSGDVRGTSWSVDSDGCGKLSADSVDIRLPLRGAHNIRNAMLALAVARELGVSVDDAGRGLAAMSAPPMRVNWEQYPAATLINDAYNSNPGSAKAAIELLAHTGRGRQRVAILATMLELGPQGPRLHDDVARAALDAGIELVAAIGEFAAAVRRVAAGGSALDPSIVSRLVGRGRGSGLDDVTPREREVLELMAEGRSNKAIAERLFVSEYTVEKHVGNIFTTLRLPVSPDDHRRVLAVVAYLNAQ